VSRVDLLSEPDLSTRIGVVVFLLDHWADFFETAARDDGPSGDGGVFLLPGMSRHRSVVELGRALESLWWYVPGCSAHLFAFYAAPFRTTTGWRDLKVKGRKRRLEVPVRERVLPSWVKRSRVEDGVRFVAQKPRSPAEAVVRPWCFRGEPHIPLQLLERPRAGVGSSDEPVAA
jgi:hypothetical protein